MSLDVIHGESRNRQEAQALARALASHGVSGTLYLGYPVIATADERVEVDALLVSRQHGLIGFLTAPVPQNQEEWRRVVEEQDRLYTALESMLLRYDSLRRRRGLAVVLGTATIFPAEPKFSEDDGGVGFYGTINDISTLLQDRDPIDDELVRSLQAALQRVTTIKPPKKRAGVERSRSRGAVLKEIEREIANLDSWQKAAAIESPEGPQRIRGLAGSGKTVVLALKAAYWHVRHPDWVIAFTFHSRSLYQQVDDLTTRFTFEQNNDRPDFDRLRILHAWGSQRRPGIYSLIAGALNEPVRDWAYAREKYGQEDALRGVCAELLEASQTKGFEPIFDAALIDEAQDLPPEFFQLVYAFTKDPKRIVWGYDELQRLSEDAMPDTAELFGTDDEGRRLVNLDWVEGEPRKDIVLPVCYRNTPWALTTAHALGIGVYREGGLLQHPDDPRTWRDIGYEVEAGDLDYGERVTLRRGRLSAPEYFERLLEPDDAVIIRRFEDEKAQDVWVAEEIAKNLSEDELEPDDILIVFPDPYTSRTRAWSLASQLRRRGIDSHLVGVGTSADEVFLPDSVAMTHIFRAKGNEAPMVYAVDAQRAASDFNVVTKRNILFTAITRSRAWVRVTGHGEKMRVLKAEADRVLNGFRLTFTVPTSAELAELRDLHRERPAEEEREMRAAAEALRTFLDAIDKGVLDIANLPPALRTRLVEGVKRRAGNDDGSGN